MKSFKIFFVLISSLIFVFPLFAEKNQTKILIVCSYARGYPWAEDTHRGAMDALLEFGYLENQEQLKQLDENDYVETSKAIIKKEWMDTKKKSHSSEIKDAVLRIMKNAKEFSPDIILLGDDNAVKYIGKKFFRTNIPVVFWGVNNTPVKYGLLKTKDEPGFNITGVYQKGYYVEGVNFLKKIVPEIKTFAILSDATPTGRLHVKAIEECVKKGSIDLKLVETVSTKYYEVFQEKAKELSSKVDAFFVAQYSGFIKEKGEHVSTKEAAEWYFENIKIPEVTILASFVKQGMLCAADESGYNQSFEAVKIANDILNGKDPATYPARPTDRGLLTINSKRAEKLNIILTEFMGIEKSID